MKSLPSRSSCTLPGLQPVSTRPKPIRIMVIDDHPMVRAGVISVISADQRFQVVAEAADGAEGLTKAKLMLPDLVIMDISLPKMSGLALTRTLRAELPDVRVVFLSMYPPDKVALAVLRSGARGYVCKAMATSELIKAIETVAGGQPWFGVGFARRSFETAAAEAEKPRRKELSARERDVLMAIADGLSNKEVASRLDLGVRTIETHRDSIMRKLDIHSVAGLTAFAVQKGMVTI